MRRRLGTVLLVVAVALGTFLLLRGGRSDLNTGSDAVTRTDATAGRSDVASLRGTSDAAAPSAVPTDEREAAADSEEGPVRPVRGVVLDGEGRPLAEAHVFLLPKGVPGWSEKEAQSAGLPRTRTGEDGGFDLGALETTGRWLGVLADGHLPAHLDGDRLDEELAVQLASGPLVHVTVVGPDDGPLEMDTSLLLQPAGDAWDWPAPDGAWAFQLEAAVAERTREAWVPVATHDAVTVEADYRHVDPIVEPEVITVIPPGDAAFRILPSCVIDFRVLDAATGAPLPVGFCYWLLLDGEIQTGGGRSVSGGEMHVAYRLPPAPYTAIVEALGYLRAEVPVAGLARYGDRSTVEVALERDLALASLRVSIPVLATLPKVAGPEGGLHAPPAFSLWMRSQAMARSYVQKMKPEEASVWGGLAGTSRRESDTDYVFEAVPAGETVLLVAEWRSHQVAVLSGVAFPAGKTNAVVAALEPGIVFAVQSLDVEGTTIQELTVRHPVHGELPAYWTRGGSAAWLDPGEKPEPDWTLGPYPGPEIEVVTVDDEGRTRTHRIRLDEDAAR